MYELLEILQYESEGIMGSHVTFTPKISKLDVYLEYTQVQLSSNFPIEMNLLCTRFDDLGIPNYEPWIVHVNINTMVEWKVP